MTIGIGGAGSKVALKQNPESIVINVSETEMEKLNAKPQNCRLAVLHAEQGQLRGSRKNPDIGRDAFQSIKSEILRLIKGNLIFSSTGGGTGTGISSSILEAVAQEQQIPIPDRSMFAFILPYADMEADEFVINTTNFLRGPVSEAIDSALTGNILLYSNKVKFVDRLAEDEFNEMIAKNINTFLAITQKNIDFKLLDGHIDQEDFLLYTAKPYFNYFTYFDFDPEQDFGKQLQKNLNRLLLPPENPIEALFLLEVPSGVTPTSFYKILEYFLPNKVTPHYSVVENPDLKKPFLTISMLYSRKPAELVDDFNRISTEHAQAVARKAVEQTVKLTKLEINLEAEAKHMVKGKGSEGDTEILAVLRRLGKLK